jgi:hypothetical protein
MNKDLFPFSHLKGKVNSPQENFHKFKETKSELFDEQNDAHNITVTFEDIQECMNIYVDMHGRVDKPIASILFENVLRIRRNKAKRNKHL